MWRFRDARAATLAACSRSESAARSPSSLSSYTSLDKKYKGAKAMRAKDMSTAVVNRNRHALWRALFGLTLTCSSP